MDFQEIKISLWNHTVCPISSSPQFYCTYSFCFYFTESPVESLLVPDNSRHSSDGVQLFDRVHSTGMTNGFDSQSAADLGDSEVQEILGNGTATVQVLVEMNGRDDSNTEAGWASCFSVWSHPPSWDLALPLQFQNQHSIPPAEYHWILFTLLWEFIVTSRPSFVIDYCLCFPVNWQRFWMFFFLT